MIGLSSNHHLVAEQGCQTTLDVEGIRLAVRDCCLAVGVQETWLADQMELALDDFFMARAERGGGDAIPASTEIDALVARLLLAAGYRDVAAEYSRRRQLQASPVADTAPWDTARIRRLLGQSYALPEAVIARLAQQVVRKLDGLGFRQVSDRLILELAGHLAGSRTPPGPAIPGLLESDSPWLLAAGFWKSADGVAGPARRLCEAGILRPRPVSRLLPVPGVVLDLERLALEAGAVTEDDFWPRLHHVTLAVREILGVMDALLAETEPDAAGGVPRVLVTGFPALAAAWKPLLRKADQPALMREIPARIRQTLAQAGVSAAIVHLQREE